MSSNTGEKRAFAAAMASTALATATAYYALESIYSRIQSSRSRKDAANAKGRGGASSLGLPLDSTNLEKYGGCIYLDYNATTPIYPEVTAAMAPFTWACFGNPSSPHAYAAPCRDAVAAARKHVAKLVRAESEECIVFTSCGSESDNRAIDIALHQYYESIGQSDAGVDPTVHPPHVISSTIEHPAVLQYLKHLEARGYIELTLVGVDKEGCVNPRDIERSLSEHRQNTALVTIMHSNNEVGTVQPIRQIGTILRRFCSHNSKLLTCRPLFHSDAAQSLGKVGVDVASLGVDLLTIVGHKFGAPKGVAALYLNHELITADGNNNSTSNSNSNSSASNPFVPIEPFLYGGGQEGGLRAGTENVLLIAALGEASRIAHEEESDTLLHLLALKRRLIIALRSGLEKNKSNGAAASAAAASGFLQFNGPERSNDPHEIASDIGLLRLILNPISTDEGSGMSAEDRFFAGVKGKEQASTSAATADIATGTSNDVSLFNKKDQSSSPSSPSSGNNSKGSFSRTSAGLVEQLPNTVSVSFRGVQVTKLMPLLVDKVACSAGSACHTTDASGGKLSPVLEAMGVDPEYGRGTLRLSFGRHTTTEDIDAAASIIVGAVLSVH